MLQTALNEFIDFKVLHVKHMLHRAMNAWFDFAVLHVVVFITSLLCSGYIEPTGYLNLKFKCYIGQ